MGNGQLVLIERLLRFGNELNQAQSSVLCGVFAYVATRDASRQKFRTATVLRNIT